MAVIPQLLPMLEALIAAPSVSCIDPRLDQSNKAVIDHLATWCAALGFRVEILPIPGVPGKFNLLATLGNGSDGLVLAGHTDTVPFDEQGWQSDPFKLTQANGRLYGLGTADMKGFFPVVLETLRTLGLPQRKLDKPLIILATADEETSMSGAGALLNSGRQPGRYAVIGEPTGLRPVNRHKGILMESLRLHGQSGHSSNPALGNSALEGMHRVIGALLAWRKQLQEKYNNPAFEVAFPTMNFGHIHGGDNPNRICGECELHLDLRPLPGMLLNELRAEIYQKAQQAVAGTGLRLECEPLFAGTEAMETAVDKEIVQVAEALTGHSAESVAFATEGGYLTRMGMDTVILGPGSIAQAHQPNEFIAVDALAPAMDVFGRCIRHFCTKRA